MRVTEHDLAIHNLNSRKTLLSLRPELPAGIASTATITRRVLGRNIFKDRITFTATTVLSAGADNASLGAGIQIMPEYNRLILPRWGRLALTLSSTLALGETTAGEIGIGTTVASGAVAVLSGTAGFENFLTGQTIGNISAGGTLAVSASRRGEDAAVGSVVGYSLYLNHATAYSDEASAHGVNIVAGSYIEFSYEVLAEE